MKDTWVTPARESDSARGEGKTGPTGCAGPGAMHRSEKDDIEVHAQGYVAQGYRTVAPLLVFHRAAVAAAAGELSISLHAAAQPSRRGVAHFSLLSCWVARAHSVLFGIRSESICFDREDAFYKV